MALSDFVKTCASCNNTLPVPDRDTQVFCIFNPPVPVVLNVNRHENGLISGIEQIAVFPIMDKRSVCRKWEQQEQIELPVSPANSK